MLREPPPHAVKGHAAPIVAVEAGEARELGVRVLPETMITDLLVADGECVGALALAANGTVTAIHAEAVVLATGGGGSLFTLNFGPPDVTADGCAMALRAGAELLNMEFMQSGPGVVYPVRGELESWVWALQPRLYNAEHDDILPAYVRGEAAQEAVMEARAAHYPFSSATVSRYLDIAVKEEVEAGRGTTHQGVYLDFTKVDLNRLLDTPRREEIRKLWPLTLAWFAERGVDLTARPVEITIFAHALNGGLRIDEQCETRVPGLLAAGETAGGPHGADRLGGNMIPACQVFGRRAGRFAAARAAKRAADRARAGVVKPQAIPVPEAAFAAAVDRTLRRRRQSGTLSVHEVKKRLREQAWSAVLVSRSGPRLERFLAELDQLAEALNRTNITSNQDWRHVLEIEDMILTARAIVGAALRRTESRGSHYRADFPQKDGAGWAEMSCLHERRRRSGLSGRTVPGCVRRQPAMAGPKLLEDIRILSFTQFLLGPAGVQYLADMGADVIKVEPPGGAWERHWSGCQSFLNGQSLFHLMTHRNSRSIILDLKNPEGQAVARRLAAHADVVVQNFRPGVMEKWGLDYATLRADNPKLIYASVSGYGQEGPYRHLPGQDLLIQALTGLADVTGRGDGPPTAVGASVVDQHGAALLAVGVLAALLHRTRTGEGQHLELTMVQAGLDLQMESVTYHLNGFPVRRSPSGLASGTEEAPYGIYRTRDGHVALSLVPIKLLHEVTGDDRLTPYLDPGEAWPRRDEIRGVLEEILATRTTAEWVEPLRARGAWVQAVDSYDDCFRDPAVQQLDVVTTVQHPEAGELKVLKFPIRFGACDTPVRSLPPAAGAHTDEVLREVGYTESEIEQLRQKKVFGA